jgi:hypothetical protein
MPSVTLFGMKPLPVPFHVLERIRELTWELHHEAEECAKAGLYRPACVMLGAALEGRLLHTAIMAKVSRGEWESLQKDDPLKWQLRQLVDFATAEGWIPNEFRAQGLDFDEGDLGTAVTWLKGLRNLIHPGRFIRAFEENEKFPAAVFEAAYETLNVVFERLTEVVDDLVRAMFGPAALSEQGGADLDPGSAKVRLRPSEEA